VFEQLLIVAKVPPEAVPQEGKAVSAIRPSHQFARDLRIATTDTEFWI
jgi:hypothetical protein